MFIYPFSILRTFCNVSYDNNHNIDNSKPLEDVSFFLIHNACICLPPLPHLFLNNKLFHYTRNTVFHSLFYISVFIPISAQSPSRLPYTQENLVYTDLFTCYKATVSKITLLPQFAESNLVY